MARVDRLRAEFVEKMPDTLEDGVIYVSHKYRVALHNCCCGCGKEVSTPLGPTEYSLKMVGDAVTIRPSIGNHDFACRSHYLITAGSIVWSGAMSRKAIEAGRAHDRYLKRGRKLHGVRVVFAWLKGLFDRLLR